jgi:integrase/recombinase XerD
MEKLNKKLNMDERFKKNIGATAKDWELCLKVFLNDGITRNLAPKTIEWYEESLRGRLLKKVHVEPQKFTKINLEYLIENMKKDGLKITSINTYLRSIRAFFGYLREEEGLKNLPKVKLLKEDKEPIKAFKEEDIRKLIEKPKKKNLKNFADLRDYVIVCFLLGTGVRLNTFINIKISDIDFENREVYLRKMKGREQIRIPLSFSLAKTLNEYLQIRGREPEDFLFCNVYGEQMKGKNVEDRVRLYCKKRLGKEKSKEYRCSPHTFRHTFAILYMRNGGDLLTLQKLLGHKSISITTRYVNLLPEDVKREFAKFSPLDNITNFRNTSRKAIRLK